MHLFAYNLVLSDIHSLIDLHCSQSSIFSFFSSIVELRKTDAREMNPCAKQRQQRAQWGKIGGELCARFALFSYVEK